MKKKIILIIITLTFLTVTECKAKHYPTGTTEIVDYARSQALSVVDKSFRGSWVISPEYANKIKENQEKLQKSFDSLAKVKIGSSSRDVRKTLKDPLEIRNNGQIWIYGTKKENGSYDNLTQVFFNENSQNVIGIITHDKNNIVENIGVNIGDSIEKLIDVYGEPVNEKDYIEDPANKHYLGLYYLYPSQGIGFLLGKDNETNELLVEGVLVFGKN